MNDIINFQCARIQIELDRYALTNTIPNDLLDGAYSIDDIEECVPNLSNYYQSLAEQLIAEYGQWLGHSLIQVKQGLRKDYDSTMRQLQTTSVDFMFPTVSQRYRKGLSPVTALYYEARELIRRYNHNCDRHVWLYGLLTDRTFNNRLIDALSKDIQNLERIIKRYYWTMCKLSTDIPLELFHARQLVKDFKHYIIMFESILYWDPEEG